jgi:DNA-directed RNA polymerase specialized sigma24 family protein
LTASADFFRKYGVNFFLEKEMALPAASPEAQQAVLTTATIRAADFLGLSSGDLARVLGVSPASVTRMRQGSFRLERGSKAFELAQLLVRLFRSLDSIVGGDGESLRSWMTSINTALGHRPMELIQTVRGLVATVDYVDSRRAVL